MIGHFIEFVTGVMTCSICTGVSNVTIAKAKTVVAKLSFDVAKAKTNIAKPIIINDIVKTHITYIRTIVTKDTFDVNDVKM